MRPHPEDPPDLWRQAASVCAAKPAERAALLDALGSYGAPEHWAIAGPVLLHRVRGAARAGVLKAVESHAARVGLSPSLRYALVDELLGSSGATRAACVRVLRADAECGSVGLALSIAARLAAVRPATARSEEALRAWVRAGGRDPLAGADGPETWRAWLDGRALPADVVHGLLLASAGAPRASVEQVRRVVQHLVETQMGNEIPARSAEPPFVSEAAAGLLRWLGRDAPGRDDLPASALNAGWPATAARVLAHAAVATEGPHASLAWVSSCCTEGAFECALAAAVVRACVLDARRGPGDASAALGDAAPGFALALAGVRAESAPAGADFVALVRALLGRDAGRADESVALATPAWLAPPARAELLRVALANPALGARDEALTLLERTGTAPSLVAPLRALAQGAPDAMTRARARALAAAPAGTPLVAAPPPGLVAAQLTGQSPQLHRP